MKYNKFKKLVKISIVLLVVLFQQSLFAQGDGPRTMLLAPNNLNLFTPAYLNLSSNFNFAQDILIDGADISSSIVPVTYIRYFSIGNRFAQIWVTPMWGNIKGKIERDNLSLDVPTTSGFADPYIAMRIGIIGAPALSIKEFKMHKQEFQLHFLLGASVPLGKYNQNLPVNLGTNRWAIRIAAPMVLPFGNNPAKLFFLEMTPSIMIYTDNNSPYGASKRTQAPLFILESHLSHNFTSKFWSSIDLRLQQGGKTETDGVNDDNNLSQLGGGLTVGYSILKPLGISLSYGNIFLSDKSKGEMLRMRITMMF